MLPNGLPKLDGFLPEQPKEIFASPGKCIYCGTSSDLSDEHIIPFALGGKLVLEKSSCPSCAKIISDFEQTCMRTMYGPLRLLYNLPTRRPKQRPKRLELKVKYRPEEKEWQTALVEQNKFPFLITFPYFDTPGILNKQPIDQSKGAVTKKLWIRGASPYYSFHDLLELLLKDLKAYSVFPESKADVPAFCKLLAKIAHSYAITKLGLSGFNSELEPLIIKNELSNCGYYIGSTLNDEPAKNQLHDLALLEFKNIDAILVKVRLLCKLGTPTYIVAVGKRL